MHDFLASDPFSKFHRDVFLEELSNVFEMELVNAV
jgi:hypothetical protein